jgi:hypothetical protein
MMDALTNQVPMETTREQEQAIEDLLNLPGIVITGLKTIGKFMGVSPSAISRWRVCFWGRTDPLLCFPLMMFPTGKGLAFTYKTHTSMIAAWMLRWSIIDKAEQGKRTIGEKGGEVRLAREEADSLHEGSPRYHPLGPLPPDPPCCCSRCSPHLHPEQAERESVDWEPAPVIPEPSPEPMRTRRPEGCLCGTGLFCAVCDN